ncbi:InlB B-repeat-containing protein [Eubacterium sp. F2]|uniref:InlB B-repeat-containing protein n=1 Tax=Eubacterium sp. F2 TaxID=3381348 RepID=UPI003908223D
MNMNDRLKCAGRAAAVAVLSAALIGICGISEASFADTSAGSGAVSQTSANEHTVTFHPGNGADTFTQTVVDGGKLSEPTAPVNKGYTFSGWYTDSMMAQQYDFSSPVTSDLNLYAKWTKVNKPIPFINGLMLSRVTARGSSSQKLTWKSLDEVDGYYIYRCSVTASGSVKGFKKIADVKSASSGSYLVKNLKKGKIYGYYVVAYVSTGGKNVVVKTSPKVYSVAGNSGAGKTNVKSVKAVSHKITLKRGKTYVVRASASGVLSGKGLLSVKGCSRFRYQTSNRFVASVGGKTGKVKAVNKGKAVIYVLGINGSSDSVVVTVK